MSQIIVNDKLMQTTHKTVFLVLNELGLNQEPYVVAVDGKVVSATEVTNIFIKNGMNIRVTHPTTSDDTGSNGKGT